MRTPLTAILLALLAAAPAEARVRLDRDFAGGHGWRTLRVGGGDAGARAVLRTRSGKLVVAGYTSAGLGFARLHPSGRYDRRFSRDGRLILRDPELQDVAGIVETAGGGVLAGATVSNYYADMGEVAVLRITRGGRLDRRYGETGIARVAIPGLPETVGLVGMVRLPGDALLLLAHVRASDLEIRVVTVRVDPAGRAAPPVVHDIDNHYAVDVVRLGSGAIVLAATRYRGNGLPAHSILHAVTADGQLVAGARRDVEGMNVEDLARDGDGLAALFTTGGHWGVRRFTGALRARRAPRRLPSGGRPTALAMDRRHRAWVGFDGGRIARVRPDGRPDRRFARPNGRTTPITRRYVLSTTDLAVHPRGGAFAVGRAHQDFDIREDYGPSRMWIGRFF